VATPTTDEVGGGCVRGCLSGTHYNFLTRTPILVKTQRINTTVRSRPEKVKYFSYNVFCSVIPAVSQNAGEKASARYTSGYAALRLTGPVSALPPLSRGDFYIAFPKTGSCGTNVEILAGEREMEIF